MHTDSTLRRARMAAVALTAATLLSFSGCNTGAPTLATTMTSLSASATSANVGTAVTLSSTLTGGSGAFKPTGVINFFDGAVPIQPVTLANGTTVTATTSTLTAGAHTITASYYGDTANAGSTSSAVTVNIYQPTTIALKATPALAAVADPVTLTAVVNGGNLVPTGTVTFSSGATVLGSTSLAVVNNQDTAVLITTALPLGVDTVTATYNANGAFLAATSNGVVEQIHGPLVSTSVMLSSSPATVSSGTNATLTATLVPSTGSALSVAGTVTFFDGAVNLGTATFTGSSMTASLTTRQFTVGANALTASFSGDIVYAASVSPSTPLIVTPYAGATYTNPLNMNDPATGKVYNCPDPAVVKYAAGGSNTWYAYCTGDAFNAADTAAGAFKAHLISIFSSPDLVNWTYVRDALPTLPSWVRAGNELQTPAISFFNGTYHLYYEAPASAAAPNGSAIGVATAQTPAGPFVDNGSPVIAQSLACGGGCNRTTFSPEVIDDGTGQKWIVYGGVFAGLSIRKLSADGFTSNAASEINIAVDNYYQNPYIQAKNGYFYEFVTAGGCCNGVLSTNNVHVGRSKSITGPYLDAEGNDLNAYSTPASVGAPGGDPVLMMNGNDIVGAGSNTVITDESGQDYIVYSGVSKRQPYLPTISGYTARQLMMDALDWVNGWPVARGGFGPSDYTTPQPLPAAQPGVTNGYVPTVAIADTPGTLIPASSDEFNLPALDTSKWSFLHVTPNYSMSGSAYTVRSVNKESIFAADMAGLGILSEPEPAGNYLLEVKVSSTVPANGYVFNYTQAGLFIYSSDTNYLRLDEVPVFETRQIEYLNELSPTSLAFAPVGTPNFGASTYLRIAKRAGTGGAPDTYTSYSSTDGVTFLKGPTWTASFGAGAKIGLFAGNTVGYTASFDYVRVSTLLP